MYRNSLITTSVFFAVLILFRCNIPRPTKNFDDYYQSVKHIQINQAFDKEAYSAIFILEKLTGLSSSASYGDISIYLSEADIKNDLQMWNKWKFDNRSKFSIEDSLRVVEKEVLSSLDWLESD
ncbi:MAG: hypothetical protein AAFP00_03120 [Bacteroidota bacterium]